ncbi:MAG: bacterial transcriptional activator domain-containing protein [Acidimicrobiia bacterium]|nr:bacterial transcriptional activator domain-containing protein [Acidimicrobiia bacterium]
MAAARSALGEGRHGGRLLPQGGEGRYVLRDRAVTDYGLFWTLVDQAETIDNPTTAAELLAEALTLVAGEPFTGVGRGFAWVAPRAGMIVAQVVDAAEELAEIRLATGDWRGAEWAARRAYERCPQTDVPPPDAHRARRRQPARRPPCLPRAMRRRGGPRHGL